eukprot:1156535-Pelagomonas_calceolata.AAC.8
MLKVEPQACQSMKASKPTSCMPAESIQAHCTQYLEHEQKAPAAHKPFQAREIMGRGRMIHGSQRKLHSVHMEEGTESHGKSTTHGVHVWKRAHGRGLRVKADPKAQGVLMGEGAHPEPWI